MAHPLLGEDGSTRHRHSAGFEPPCTLPFSKKVKSPQGTRRCSPTLSDDHSPCAALVNFSWCWRVLRAAISIALSFRCADHHPIRIRDGLGRLVNAPPVMTRAGAQLGAKHLPRKRLRLTTETRLKRSQPSRHAWRKGTDPPSGAEEKTARTISVYAQYACLLPLKMGSINQTTL